MLGEYGKVRADENKGGAVAPSSEAAVSSRLEGETKERKDESNSGEDTTSWQAQQEEVACGGGASGGAPSSDGGGGGLWARYRGLGDAGERAKGREQQRRGQE